MLAGLPVTATACPRALVGKRRNSYFTIELLLLLTESSVFIVCNSWLECKTRMLEVPASGRKASMLLISL